MGKKFVHNCELNIEFKTLSSDIRKKYFCKYIYRKLFLISGNVKYRQNLKMSQYGAERERQRQLQEHPYVIHPLSMFRFYWEVFMVSVFLLQVICMPHFVLQNEKIRLMFTIDRTMNAFINTFCMMDFFFNFITGRFEKNKQRVILEPKRYIKYYCLTYAIPDLISSFPFEHIYYFSLNKSTVEVRQVVAICKFFHIFRFMSYLNTIREKREFAVLKFKICQTLLFYVLGFSYCISFIGIAKVVENNINFSQLSYKSCMFAACNMIFGLEHDILILHTRELIVHLAGRIFGAVIGVIFIAQVVTFGLCTYKTEYSYYRQNREIEQYMFLKELSPSIKDRVREYERFMYEGHCYNEEKIWSSVSGEMEANALYYILKHRLQSDIFHLCPEEVIHLLIPYLHKRLLLTGDVLYRANTPNSSFFFIHSGSVRILTDDNEEVAILFDGKVFTDVSPSYSKEVVLRKFTVVANECSEIYGMKYKYLYEVLLEYPDIHTKVTDALQKRNEIILQDSKTFNLNKYYSIEE